MKKYKVAVVGATGMVGRTFVELLEERKFPISELRLLASENSTGEKMVSGNEDIRVQVLNGDSFDEISFAFFSAGTEISKKFAPIAVKAGAIVIDNSSAFRMDHSVPLIIPEVNPDALKRHSGIIANPNCSTIQMVVVASPLHDAATIKRIVVSTYQSVSGQGKDALMELRQQCEALFAGKEISLEIFPHQIAFNLIPQIDIFLDDGYTKEELKMVIESRKIMGLPNLPVSATCVRVPVFNSHGISLNLEFEQPIDVKTARSILFKASGVTVLDELKSNRYPTPQSASDKDEVFVGRIRKDDSIENGLNLWVVADNLRKGAALNAIQIAERMI